MPATTARDKMASILRASDEFMAYMRQLGQAPNNVKVLERLFGPSEAAAMVGRDRTSLARAEEELGIALPRSPTSGRRAGYTLEHVNAFRAHFGTLPWRDPNSDPPLILAVQNFKGGVGKSTTTVNLAQFLALKGYRVLILDADNQATTTSMFGYTPDLDFSLENTFFPYVSGDIASLEPVILKTYFPGIHLIPGCMPLTELEVRYASHFAETTTEAERVALLYELREGLGTVLDSYDVVLIDSPPSLGMISLSVLLAADAIIVPCGAKMYDFSSTKQFFEMIERYVPLMAPKKDYLWVKVVTTLFDTRYPMQREFAEALRRTFSDSVFQRAFFHSSEIINTAAVFTTPYEQKTPNRSVLQAMDAVFGEIEVAILREWRSKQQLLNQQGIA